MALSRDTVGVVTMGPPKLNNVVTSDGVGYVPWKENLMDIPRLQIQCVAPKSRTSSLPLGLQTPVTLDPLPDVPRPAASLSPLADGMAVQLFGHYAAAWKARLGSFLTDDPISRA